MRKDYVNRGLLKAVPGIMNSELGKYLKAAYGRNPDGMRRLLLYLDADPTTRQDVYEMMALAVDLEGRDPLTGLYNRRHFNTTLNREIQKSNRTHNPLAVAVVDIDYFKKINDAHNHESGDKVLQSFASQANSVTREYLDEVARLGGEEFGVFWHRSDLETGLRLAEKLRERAGNDTVKLPDGSTVNYTVSIGVAMYPFDGIDSTPEIIDAADRAMFNAKRSGRNRVASAGDLKQSTIAKIRHEEE